ncbi:unnamed protein product [Prunus brigantina]
MEQCEDLIYRFKRFNADKKLNLNFVRVTEEMVEAYLREDAEVDSSSGSESDGEEEKTTPPTEPLIAREDEGRSANFVKTIAQFEALIISKSNFNQLRCLSLLPNISMYAELCKNRKMRMLLKEKLYKSVVAEGPITCDRILNVRHSKGGRGFDRRSHGIGKCRVGRC